MSKCFGKLWPERCFYFDILPRLFMREKINLKIYYFCTYLKHDTLTDTHTRDTTTDKIRPTWTLHFNCWTVGIHVLRAGIFTFGNIGISEYCRESRVDLFSHFGKIFVNVFAYNSWIICDNYSPLVLIVS